MTTPLADVLVVPHFVNVDEAERRVQIPTLEGIALEDLDALFV